MTRTLSTLARKVPPVERVRRAVASTWGPETAALLPRGYQRLGSVVLIRFPPSVRPIEHEFGALYQEALHVRSVLALENVKKGERREPETRLLAGEDAETLVHDGPMAYHLDAARLLYSAGNMEERHRAARLVRRGERVADLFAGIGYFALPAAKLGGASCVYAVEKNPLAYAYLERNIFENSLTGRVIPLLGDNRVVDLPVGTFDRVFLGYLPSSVPYVKRAVSLLSPQGGWLHVHTVNAPRRSTQGERAVRETIARASGKVSELVVHRVKSYGPSREHWTWDARVTVS